MYLVVPDNRMAPMYGLNSSFTSTNARDSWYVDGRGQTTGDDHVILFLKRTF